MGHMLLFYLRQHRTIPALRLKHRSGSCGTASALPKYSIMSGCGTRIVLRGAKAPRILRPLPLLRFAVSSTGGAHLCSIQYYLRFWLGICRTSLAVSALRIMRYCPEFFEHRDNRRLYRLHRWRVCLRQRHRRHQPRRFLLVRLPAGVKQVAQKYDNQKQLPPPRGCFWFIKSHFAVKLKRFIKMNTTFLLYSTRKTVAIRARLQSCTQNPKND